MTATPRASRSGPGLLLAEVSLVAVHLAVVVGFGRLYDGNGHLFDLAAFTVSAHVLAAAVRRLRLPVAAGWAVGLGGAVLVSTWLLFADTTAWGIPTSTTLDHVRVALDVARDEFRTVAAPTAPIAGFQLLAGLGLWGAAWFADWAAFRLRTTAEALAPATIVFVFCTVLGTGDSRFLVAVLFAGSVVFFVANHRAHLAEMDNAWLSTSAVDGARSVRRAALGLGATVVLAGAVVAPLVPGYDDDALLRWRNRAQKDGVRTTVSPIVDLRRRLVNQSDREMFRVTSDVPSYWRLTALPDFDGKIWSSGGAYGEAEHQLPSSGDLPGATEDIVQTIQVQSLSTIWVPAAFQARSLQEASRPLRWDPETATLIVDATSDDSNGLRYTVTSQRPVLDPVALRRTGDSDPDAITEHYLDLPETFPSLAATEAQRATAGHTTRYDRARALQDYFRDGSFEYDTDIGPGHDNDALVSFLEERRGYCEQFAGAYAAMARSVGIPARVAVGFTEGERDPLDGSFQVRGIHAHAWPEVYFPEVGWVPFEPTPDRGIPGAEEYTGVPPQQAGGAEPPQPTPSAVTTTTSTPAPTTPTTTAEREEVPVRGTLIPSAEPEPPNRFRTALTWLGVAALIWLLVVLAAPRVRAASRRAAGDDRAVLDAWDDALGPVRWSTGLRPRPSESHAEFARRAGPALAGLAGPVTDLADLAERAAWDPTPSVASDTTAARSLSSQIHDGVTAQESVARRVWRRLSWREAFGVPRRGNAAGPAEPTPPTGRATVAD